MKLFSFHLHSAKPDPTPAWTRRSTPCQEEEALLGLIIRSRPALRGQEQRGLVAYDGNNPHYGMYNLTLSLALQVMGFAAGR